MSQRTLAIIKPDAVDAQACGTILQVIEKNGFVIDALKKVRFNRLQAGGFYAVHAQKPFFEALLDFMTSGPSMVCVLRRENAIATWREIMGATNPLEAEPDTLRRRFGTDVTHNACHGSDSEENARKEIAFFFSESELLACCGQ